MTNLYPCTSTEHNWARSHHHQIEDGRAYVHRHPGCPGDCPDKAFGPTQSADEEGAATEAPLEGVWVSYSDEGTNLTLFPCEIDALRHAVDRYANVRFLRFGEPFAPEQGRP